MKTNLIACVAGKSGGHIVPCLTYAHHIQTNNEKIIFFSNNTPLDHEIIKKDSDVITHIPFDIPTRYGFLGKLITSYNLFQSFIQALVTLYQNKPRIVISTGGIESLPVFIAAWILQIPTTLFELNAVPGKASEWCGYFATTIHVCFKETLSAFNSSKTTYHPYPLQKSITAASKPAPALTTKKTLLVLGGSQGSIALNTLIKDFIESNLEFYQKNIHIIHQTGSRDSTNWISWYSNHHISAEHFPFTENLAPFYQRADLIIARAGAGTLFEIAYLKKKAIIIPLKISSADHQTDNAMAIARDYPTLFTVIDEHEFYQKQRLIIDIFSN